MSFNRASCQTVALLVAMVGLLALLPNAAADGAVPSYNIRYDGPTPLILRPDEPVFFTITMERECSLTDGFEPGERIEISVSSTSPDVVVEGTTSFQFPHQACAQTPRVGFTANFNATLRSPGAAEDGVEASANSTEGMTNGTLSVGFESYSSLPGTVGPRSMYPMEVPFDIADRGNLEVTQPGEAQDMPAPGFLIVALSLVVAGVIGSRRRLI